MKESRGFYIAGAETPYDVRQNLNFKVEWYSDAISRRLYNHFYDDKKTLGSITSQLIQQLSLLIEDEKTVRKVILDLFACYQTTNGKASIGVFVGNGEQTNKNSKQYKIIGTGYRSMKRVVSAMNEAGYVSVQSGCLGHSTKLQATGSLISFLLSQGLKLQHYSCGKQWPIVYTEIQEDDESGHAFKHKVRIERPKAESLGLKTLFEINSLYSKSDIRIGNEPLLKHEKKIRRIYGDPDGTTNGRLYGPIWQNIAGDARHLITINGMETAEIDICSTHPLIAYALNGYDLTSIIPEEGKPYQIAGINTDDLVFRQIIKQMLLTMFNASSRNQALRGVSKFINQTIDPDTGRHIYKERWESYCDVFRLSSWEELNRLMDKLLDKHHRIENFFFSSGWKILNLYETEVCFRVLKFLLEQRDMVVLPVHDSFIVSEEEVEYC